MAKKKTTTKAKTTKAKRTISKKIERPEQHKKRQQEFIPRVLCFTTSHKRPYHLYNCINNILNNQSYKNITYAVGVCVDEINNETKYQAVLKDLATDPRLKIFYHKNMDQHDNYLYPIKALDHHKYNLFIKIDDDDIYRKEYLSTTIDAYSKYETDIVSTKSKYRINNSKIEEGSFDTVAGVWSKDEESDIKFGMPPTYAFNNKALALILDYSYEDRKKIHFFEDAAWREKWREKKLVSYIIEESSDFIYHIHRSNTSSGFASLHIDTQKTSSQPTSIEDDFCIICKFKHEYWESNLILNKRNNRVFHILHNDHGKFETLEGNAIKIIWDNWGEEKFYKIYHTSGGYYYSSKNG